MLSKSPDCQYDVMTHTVLKQNKSLAVICTCHYGMDLCVFAMTTPSWNHFCHYFYYVQHSKFRSIDKFALSCSLWLDLNSILRIVQYFLVHSTSVVNRNHVRVSARTENGASHLLSKQPNELSCSRHSDWTLAWKQDYHFCRFPQTEASSFSGFCWASSFSRNQEQA